MINWLFRVFNDKEFIIRTNDKVIRLEAKRWLQLLLVACFLASILFFLILANFRYSYKNNVDNLSDKLSLVNNNLDEVLSDFEVYRKSVTEITSDISSMQDMNAQDLRSVKMRLATLDTETKNRMVDYTNNNFKKETVNAKLAIMSKNIAVSELRELKKRTNILEDSLRDAQSIQNQIFEKVASLVDDNVEEIDKKLSSIKDTINKTGFSFDKIYATAETELLKSKNGSQGGPFIPAFTGAIENIPELKNEELSTTLGKLYLKIDNWSVYKSIEEKLPLGRPLKNIRVSAAYGNRFDPFNGEMSIHEGIDLSENEGVEVKVTAPGEVTFVGWAGLYGLMVEVDHGYNLKTRYAHLSKIIVKKGDIIKTGDKIGEVGNTGRSTGSHLHYEVRIKNTPVNPYNFIKVQKNVFKI